MADWSKSAVRGQEAENERSRFSNQPYVAAVKSVDPTGETATVDLPFGTTVLPIPQPMISDGAWIRGVPDGTGQVLVQETGDGGVPAILRWFSATSQQKASTFEAAAVQLRKDPTQKNVAAGVPSLFRSLKPGEFQAANRAGAEVFWRSDGSLQLRGGVVSRSIEAPDGTSFDRAPLHRRTTLLFSYGATIGDEERFGAVVRADPKKPAFRDLPILMPNPLGYTPPSSSGGSGTGTPGAPMSAAKEHLINLAWDGMPSVLYDRRAGHVFEDGATQASDQVVSSDTGQKLRFRERFFTTPLGNKLESVVDELGNAVVTFPLESIVGLIMRMGPKGNINLTTFDFILTALRNLVMTVTGMATITATAGLTIETPTPLGPIHFEFDPVSTNAILELPGQLILRAGQIILDSPETQTTGGFTPEAGS